MSSTHWPPRATKSTLAKMGRHTTRWSRGPVTLVASDGPLGVGYAVRKSEGPAVVRNRIRRRLREAVRVGVDPAWLDGTYLVIGRRDVIGSGFTTITETMRDGFEELHVRRSSRNR